MANLKRSVAKRLRTFADTLQVEPANQPRSALHDIERPVKDFLLNAISERLGTVRFLEVGANDGRSNSVLAHHIEKGGWTGAMVEPVPYIFERLKRNWGQSPEVSVLPCACGPEEGTLTFYSVSSPPPEFAWAEFIGSFDLTTVMNHRWGFPNVADHIVPIEVNCLTATSLARTAKLPRIDVFIIDAEGYDDKVIYSLDFDVFRPQLICFEHRHIRGDKHAALLAFGRAKGYESVVLNWDTVMLDPDIIGANELDFLRALAAALQPYSSI